MVKPVEHVNSFFAAPEPLAEQEVEEQVMYQVTQEPIAEEAAPSMAFEFELKVEEAELPFDTYSPAAEPEAPEPEMEVHEDASKTDDSIEEQLRKSKERIMRLKDLSMKLRSSNGLQELENEPAYKRKQLSLDDIPHSSESQVSRFTLSSEEGITEIRPNNSFLHDNVD